MTCSRESKRNGSPEWFFSKVIEWGTYHFRTFPWRQVNKPYSVFLSEVLLRRTTSKAVEPVFKKIIAKYPSVSSLLQAVNLEKDLRPIGLSKQRSLQMKQAAEFLMKNYDGKIPNTEEALLGIPGIGKYSSAAIVCFAYGKNVPMVDSNILRVTTRFRGETKLRVDDTLEFLSKAIGKNKAKLFNYGLLDLGALVCKPVRPLCFECPLNPACSYPFKPLKLSLV